MCRSSPPPREGEAAVRGGAGHLCAETATPHRRGERGVARCRRRGLTSPSPILRRQRAGYWRRRSEKKRLRLGRLSWLSRSLASSSPISTGQRVPRAPPFLLQPSSPQAGQEAQSRPGLAQTWVETGESALESETEHCEGTNIWPATSGVPPGRRLGWWRPVSPASSLQGNFFFPGWIKLAWIFSLSLSLAKSKPFVCSQPGIFRAAAERLEEEESRAVHVGVTAGARASRARVGDLRLRASTDRSDAAKPGDLGARFSAALPPPRDAGGRWALGPHVRLPPRLAVPAGGTSRGEVETPPSRSCAPRRLRGCRPVVPGTPPPLKVSPNCCWPPKPRRTQLGATVSWRRPSLA